MNRKLQFDHALSNFVQRSTAVSRFKHRYAIQNGFTSKSSFICRPVGIIALACFILPWVCGAESLLQPLVGTGTTPPAPWQVVLLPQQKAPATEFQIVEVAGRSVMRVTALQSYGNLVHPLTLKSAAYALSWEWQIESLNAAADVRRKSGDDVALKICVFFDLPPQAVPFLERQLLKLARARSGLALPAATLCYVWDNRLPTGTIVENAYSRRVRFLVLQSGTQRAKQWVTERRALVADFAQTFGDESSAMPALLGIAIGADADNTQSRSTGYVANLRLTR